jgi:hypothetical protein
VLAHGPRIADAFGEGRPAVRLPEFAAVSLETSNQYRS